MPLPTRASPAAVMHRYEDVFEPRTFSIKVGGVWNGEAIEEVSLIALDRLGHVTARLASRSFQTLADLEDWADALRAQGWAPSETAARSSYEEEIQRCLS